MHSNQAVSEAACLQLLSALLSEPNLLCAVACNDYRCLVLTLPWLSFPKHSISAGIRQLQQSQLRVYALQH
jgi:hypothetical protein